METATPPHRRLPLSCPSARRPASPPASRASQLRALQQELLEERVRLFWQEQAQALEAWRRSDAAHTANGPLQPRPVRAGSSRSRLEAIEHALAKLVRGSYGTCESCSTPIDLEHLRGRPAASLCRACASHGSIG